MDIQLTTPALLFPAISLLLLAYTNRFLALSALIRTLHDRNQVKPDENIVRQIGNLRTRVYLIRDMQAAGVSSMLMCVVCMFMLYFGLAAGAKIAFGVALLLMIISLLLSIVEIGLSVNALRLQLGEVEKSEKSGGL